MTSCPEVGHDRNVRERSDGALIQLLVVVDYEKDLLRGLSLYCDGEDGFGGRLPSLERVCANQNANRR
jgi:hypothetical protein